MEGEMEKRTELYLQCDTVAILSYLTLACPVVSYPSTHIAIMVSYVMHDS